MKELIVIGVVLIILYIIKEFKKEPKGKITKYPYRKDYLLTKAEYTFYKILKSKCDNNNMLICPKVRLEDFITVTDKQNIMKYRGYIKSRHIDFLICDDKLNIKCAIELDDNSHNKEKTKEVDELKNNIFNKIEIPLFRIKMSNGMYDKEVDNIILKLYPPQEDINCQTTICDHAEA